MNDNRKERKREFQKENVQNTVKWFTIIEKKRNESDSFLASVPMQKDLRNIHLCTYNQKNPEQNEHYQLQNTYSTVQRASLAS